MVVPNDARAQTKARLIAQFVPPLAREVVERSVDEAAGRYHDARIKAFVPMLVERRARYVLRQLVQEAGT